MHEVEFLPAWYPRLRRRKRALLIQGCATFVIVILLCGFAVARRLDARAQQVVLADSTVELARCAPAIARLDALLTRERQLRQQEQVIAQLGVQLDPTRLINVLEDAMPPQVTLTDLSVESRPSVAAKEEHTLCVKLQGLAPTDAQVASLLTNLGNVKFFDDVSMTYTRDHATAVQSAGQPSREFELSFSVNLR